MKPSAERVLRVLRARGPDGLTPQEARELAGTDRLAARVWELEAEGFDITRTLVTVGNGARVARYVLHETEQLTLLDSPPSTQAVLGISPGLQRSACSAGGRVGHLGRHARLT